MPKSRTAKLQTGPQKLPGPITQAPKIAAIDSPQTKIRRRISARENCGLEEFILNVLVLIHLSPLLQCR